MAFFFLILFLVAEAWGGHGKGEGGGKKRYAYVLEGNDTLFILLVSFLFFSFFLGVDGWLDGLVPDT